MLAGHPTPSAEDSESTGAHSGAADTLTAMSRLSGYPTATGTDGERRGNVSIDAQNATLNTVAARALSGYPSPNTNQRGPESRESKDNRGSGGIDLQTVAGLADYTTPQARDVKGVTQNFSNPAKPKDDSLADQVTLAGYHTPHCPREHDSDNSKSTYLDRQVSGAASPSCPTGTASRGALNPNLSAWLMGLPWSFRLAGLLAFLRKRNAKSSRRSRSPKRSPGGGCS